MENSERMPIVKTVMEQILEQQEKHTILLDAILEEMRKIPPSETFSSKLTRKGHNGKG
jgi:tRNA(Ser,Leu) C12 N-acetylase TAN1